MASSKIIDVIAKDIRFPTSLDGDGSDPMVFSCESIFCKIVFI